MPVLKGRRFEFLGLKPGTPSQLPGVMALRVGTGLGCVWLGNKGIMTETGTFLSPRTL